MARTPEHIILSRTDSIGDVMLTLPMAGLLKDRTPGVRITFIGRDYTRPVLEHCAHVDEVVTLDDLLRIDHAAAVERLKDLNADVLVHVFPERHVARWAERAGIPLRIGTSHRWWHWTTCNRRVAFSRRNSDLHEAQLNIELLRPLGFHRIPSVEELMGLHGFTPGPADDTVRSLLRAGRRHVVLHPGSRGSAVEWGLDRFAELIRMLDPDRHQVLLTGTAADAASYRPALPVDLPHVTDTGGQLSLDQLIALIGACDALVAASTGPLHIAAAAGIRAIGLYAPQRPIHPGRWAPLGRDAHALVADTADPHSAVGPPRDSIRLISPEQVRRLIDADRPG
ncbi:MAG: glycosyltransferase family 9 protein [Flavobacteriales bacterium]|nr:glycosyltransferase family 9 protein [Flavobacteriales bacterium]MCB9193247.1 glycosyltransferase family 9 protein [Flavobacteriales bacterium]